jgi:hypothetical protein
VAGWLLAMAWERGGGPVRHDRGAEDDGAPPTCPREEDEGGACTSAKEERGRPGGSAEGHWVGRLVGRHGGEGTGAATGSKTGDGPKFKKNFFSNFN